MSAGGPSAAADHEFRVLNRTERFRGPVFRLVTDEVAMPGGGTAHRDYLAHVGAVGVVALDDDDRVVLIRQYRHPVAAHLWELPAGLIDVEGEQPPATAARELAEEADLTASRWDLLADIHPTPGASDELIRLFLARDLAPVPHHERHNRSDEEAGLVVRMVDLDEAVGMVYTGEITNAACVAGLLAAARARDLGWKPLRPADTPLVRTGSAR